MRQAGVSLPLAVPASPAGRGWSPGVDTGCVSDSVAEQRVAGRGSEPRRGSRRAGRPASVRGVGEGPAPVVAAVRVAVRRLLTEVRPARVLVACSGGADSVALAAATAFEAPRLGIPAGLVTVDHGLQEESPAWAAETAELGRRPRARPGAGPPGRGRRRRRPRGRRPHGPLRRPRRGRRRPRRAARAHPRRPGRDRAARARPRLGAAVDRRHAPGRRPLAAPPARDPP